MKLNQKATARLPGRPSPGTITTTYEVTYEDDAEVARQEIESGRTKSS